MNEHYTTLNSSTCKWMNTIAHLTLPHLNTRPYVNNWTLFHTYPYLTPPYTLTLPYSPLHPPIHVPLTLCPYLTLPYTLTLPYSPTNTPYNRVPRHPYYTLYTGRQSRDMCRHISLYFTPLTPTLTTLTPPLTVLPNTPVALCTLGVHQGTSAGVTL